VQYIGALSVDSSPLLGWEIFREILDATYVLHDVDLWFHEFSDDGGAFQQHDALLVETLAVSVKKIDVGK
jgi:hypothetical protein